MPLALHEGSLFAGRYQVRRLIAEGGMGAVYEVVQFGTGRRRALKVMHGHILQSAELRERFALEARVAGEIQSEFIVEVIDAGVDQATQMPFLVMELLDGEELGKRLQRVGRFATEEVVTYLHQTAMALDKTHKASIVHRDLKPENLFLTQRDDGGPRIKILDFGVAKVIAEGATAAGMTRSLGTPLYMPPEQFSAGARLTPTADIYALGMIAYTLLVGEAYWAAETNLAAGEIVAFAMIAVRGPAEPPVRRAAARGVALPAGFDAWFAKATAVDAGQRFARASEAVNALAEVFGLAPLRTGPMPSHAEISAVRRDPPRAGSGPALTPVGAAMTAGGAVMMPGPAPRSAGRIFGIAALVVVLGGAAGILGTIGGLRLMRSEGDMPAATAAAASAAPVVTEAAAATAAPAPTPAVSALAAPAASSSAAPSKSTASPAAPISIARPAQGSSGPAPLPATTTAPTTTRKRPTPD